jgi:hypothetical protein
LHRTCCAVPTVEARGRGSLSNPNELSRGKGRNGMDGQGLSAKNIKKKYRNTKNITKIINFYRNVLRLCKNSVLQKLEFLQNISGHTAAGTFL